MTNIKVKDWFAIKVLKEKKLNMTNQANVYAIFKETEKAIYCMMCDCAVFTMTWVPKSCLEEGGYWVTRNDIDAETAIRYWNIDKD